MWLVRYILPRQSLFHLWRMYGTPFFSNSGYLQANTLSLSVSYSRLPLQPSYSYPTATLLYKVLSSILSQVSIFLSPAPRMLGLPATRVGPKLPNSDTALIPSWTSAENRPEAVTHREDSAWFDRPPLPGTRSVPSGARRYWLMGIRGVS